MPTPLELIAQVASRTDLDQPSGRGWLADLALANPTARNVLRAFALRALPLDGGLPNPIPLSERGAFDLYFVYVYIFGEQAAWDALVAGDRVILGLRVTSSTNAGGGEGVYDDRFAVLHRDLTAKTRTAKDFDGNTEPARRYDAQKLWHTNKAGKLVKTVNAKALGEDVDGDGVIDLGRIPSGTYKFNKATSDKYGNILKPDAPITLERDSNHDGTFDGQDTVKKGLEGNLKAGDTYFHKGGPVITGSAGCQTLKPATFGQFWSALGTQKGFQYVLVTVA